MAEELDWLAKRAGWAVDGEVATYSPEPGWLARVRAVKVAGRTYARWHVAIVHFGGTARYATTASTIAEAARVAEANVSGRTVT